MCRALPGDYDEKIQSVPGVGEVRTGTICSHRNHFHDHFQREEREDEVVEHLCTVRG